MKRSKERGRNRGRKSLIFVGEWKWRRDIKGFDAETWLWWENEKLQEEKKKENMDWFCSKLVF